jgi:nitrate reductase assembly molybdenum cofactor insertion protein NarJ
MAMSRHLPAILRYLASGDPEMAMLLQKPYSDEEIAEFQASVEDDFLSRASYRAAAAALQNLSH